MKENSCGMCGSLGKRPQPAWWVGYSVLLFIGLGARALAGHADVSELHTCSANVALTYRDPSTKESRLEIADMGRYGAKSPCESEWGTVVHVRTTTEGGPQGCSALLNVPSRGRWIALVRRGGCKFSQKVHIAAVLHNASAVVVYDDADDDLLLTMNHDIHWVVSVFVRKEDGEHIARLVDSGVNVTMNISVGQVTFFNVEPSPEMVGVGPPLLAISLSLVGLLILGLLAMLIYIVRRSKYVQRKRHEDNMHYSMQGVAHAQQEEELLSSGRCSDRHHSVNA